MLPSKSNTIPADKSSPNRQSDEPSRKRRQNEGNGHQTVNSSLNTKNKTAVKTWQGEVKRLRSSRDRLKAKYEKSKETLDKVQQKNEQMDSDLDKLVAISKHDERIIQNLREEIKKQVEDLDSRIEEVEKVYQFKTKIQEDRLETLEKKSKNDDLLVQNLREEIDTLQNEIENQKTAFEVRHSHMNAQCVNLDRNMKNSWALLTDERKRFESTEKYLNEEVQNLKKELELKDQKHEKYHISVNSVIQNLQQRIQDSDTFENVQSKNLERQKAEILSLKKERVEFEEKMKSEIQNSKSSDSLKFENEMKSANEKFQEMTNSIFELQNQNNHLQTLLSSELEKSEALEIAKTREALFYRKSLQKKLDDMVAAGNANTEKTMKMLESSYSLFRTQFEREVSLKNVEVEDLRENLRKSKESEVQMVKEESDAKFARCKEDIEKVLNEYQMNR